MKQNMKQTTQHYSFITSAPYLIIFVRVKDKNIITNIFLLKREIKYPMIKNTRIEIISFSAENKNKSKTEKNNTKYNTYLL